MNRLRTWFQQFEGKVFAALDHPYVQTFGSLLAKDEASALTQFKTRFATGQLPPDCYLAGPLTDGGTAEPGWVLEKYVGEAPPPESPILRKVS